MIQQFGSVEAALDNAADVKRKTYRESLLGNRDTVLLSKELVTIHCSVPLELDLKQLETQSPDPIASRTLFTELEFTTLIKELGLAEAPKQTAELVLHPTLPELEQLLIAARTGTLTIASGVEKAAAAEPASGVGRTSRAGDAAESYRCWMRLSRRTRQGCSGGTRPRRYLRLGWLRTIPRLIVFRGTARPRLCFAQLWKTRRCRNLFTT